jgi:hypothetical protein
MARPRLTGRPALEAFVLALIELHAWSPPAAEDVVSALEAGFRDQANPALRARGKVLVAQLRRGLFSPPQPPSQKTGGHDHDDDTD